MTEGTTEKERVEREEEMREAFRAWVIESRWGFEGVEQVVKRAEEEGMWTSAMWKDDEGFGMGDGWTEEAQGREILGGFSVTYPEIAEAVVGLMVCAGPYYVVGTGECARPFIEHYRGESQEVAVAEFTAEAETLIESWMEIKEYEEGGEEGDEG